MTYIPNGKEMQRLLKQKQPLPVKESLGLVREWESIDLFTLIQITLSATLVEEGGRERDLRQEMKIVIIDFES